MLDTFQISHIKKELQKKGVTIPLVGTEFNDIFHQLLVLLQREGLLKNIHSTTKVPMALTFSKIDEVIKNNLLDDDFEDFTIRKKSEYISTGSFSIEEMKDVSKGYAKSIILLGRRPVY